MDAMFSVFPLLSNEPDEIRPMSSREDQHVYARPALSCGISVIVIGARSKHVYALRSVLAIAAANIYFKG